MGRHHGVSSTTLSPAWLVAQRWFRAKQRPIAAVTEHDRAPLGDTVALRVLAVAYADDGEPDRYLVPTAHGRLPRDGDGAWTALLTAIADSAVVPGERGRFVARRTVALDELLPSAHEAAAALEERTLGVEQSNTSIALGDRLMLKLYRHLERGANPDVEMSAFLTDVDFAETPALAGSIAYEEQDGTSAAAMVQAFVSSTGDAWSAILHALVSEPRQATAMAERIGDLTARLHAALASRPEDPAFPVRPASLVEAAEWRASAERQLAQAIAALGSGERAHLVELAPRITARFADTYGSASGAARVSRIHGDYHLGQLLARTDGGFSVIDFEGEPARPLAERRQPSSPLRDVAGMLRSLDYAARTAERDASFDAAAWLAGARSALLGAYGSLGLDERAVLDAFELEKACYEVRYEANNRPSWLWLPLAAVERLATAV